MVFIAIFKTIVGLVGSFALAYFSLLVLRGKDQILSFKIPYFRYIGSAFLVDLIVWFIRYMNDGLNTQQLAEPIVSEVFLFLWIWVVLSLSYYALLNEKNKRFWLLWITFVLGTSLDFVQFIGILHPGIPDEWPILFFSWATSVVSSFVIIWLTFNSLQFPDRRLTISTALIIAISLSGQRMNSLSSLYFLDPERGSLSAHLQNGLFATTIGFDVTIILGLIIGLRIFRQYNQRYTHTISHLRTTQTLLTDTLDRLKDSEDRYRTLVEQSPIPMFVHRDTKMLYVNIAFKSLMGFTALEALDTDSLLTFFPDFIKEFQGREAQQVDAVVLSYITKTGQRGFAEITGLTVRFLGEDAKLAALIDITKERLAELRLQENERKYQELLESSPIGMLIYQKGKIRYVNPTAAKILGAIEPNEILQHNISFFIKDNDPQILQSLFQRQQALQQTFEIKARRLDDKIVDLELLVYPTRYEDDIAFQLVFQDISDRKRTADVIRYMAFHDNLTGLPNRSMIKDRMHQTLSWYETLTEKPKIAIAFIDLDRFKNLNDSLGHSAGDEVIKAVSERLSVSLMQNEFVSRLGGDEFGLLSANLKDMDEIVHFAERLMRVFAAPFQVLGGSFYLSASIGLSVYPDHGTDEETLLQNADMAMYAAKAEGKARYQLYTPTLDDQYKYRNELEQALRSALSNNEFEIFYQPVVDIATNKIVSAEALIRWPSKERGMVSPSEFIPLAEETGLIIEIGAWVTRKVAEQIVVWQNQGHYAVPIAVNASLLEFQGIDYVDRLKAILDDVGISPQLIQVEITERTMIADIDHTIATINRLHRIGVKTSMDDFGVGYSSLSYLRRLPVDKLKIDRSFIEDLTLVDGQAIVYAILVLASTLGLTVVAEGIEHEEELEYLKENGCHQAQGYLLAKPMPALQIASWLPIQNKPTKGDEV
nr:EAL domain-containing protein [Bacilli bacterium]